MLNKDGYIKHFSDRMLIDGLNCAQTMFLAVSYFSKAITKEKEAEYLFIASSLGGGVAGMKQTCGFITGALLGYSIIYDDNELVKKKVNEINDLVIKYGGSWQCEQIIDNYNDSLDNRRRNCASLLEKILIHVYDDLENISN